jgi:hypothetical protein
MHMNIEIDKELKNNYLKTNWVIIESFINNFCKQIIKMKLIINHEILVMLLITWLVNLKDLSKVDSYEIEIDKLM